MRYFRSYPATYVAVCAQLDAAYGYPNASTKTDRALPVAAALPADALGRIYLAVSSDYCAHAGPATVLPPLLASGDVEEITESEYMAALPQPTT